MKLRVPVPRPMWIALPTAVLVALVAVVHVAVLAYRQREAIQVVRRLHGSLDLNPRGPDWLRTLVGDERLEPFDEPFGLALATSDVTDADLPYICLPKNLRKLHVFQTVVSKTSLDELVRKLPDLKVHSSVRNYQ